MKKITILKPEESEIIIYDLLQTKNHKSCYKKMFTVRNLLLKKKCSQKTNLFFMLNENQFIHKKCNRLIMDTLENLKQKEIQSFWNELLDFIKKKLVS